ncbi:VOC family protein [Paenalcaligenes niemegkensis]|uniref:VOC family protein n=1 Tax=Paenalcaligenes niemegkensis TaxID=2895469 RepID=UPI001EE87AEC|nr:VOC family protein [Paenalcaligenes niemegkensis]MCQ9615548.1 VOC family protein [Paenalcaligenes niemegkensis]
MSNQASLRPFHLAFPVHDLAAARHFYGGVLGCPEGRSSEHWIDFDFYGHQIVAHLAPDECTPPQTSQVEAHQVPVRHFGVVLDMDNWRILAEKLGNANTQFIIEPHIRFEGQPGEQATLFFLDPSGNALEFKAFRDLSSLFAV